MVVARLFLIRGEKADERGWKEKSERKKKKKKRLCFFEKKKNDSSAKVFPFYFFSFFVVAPPQKNMAANALDTLRLIGKTLVVEYNAKTPSRLKVREERREAAAGESKRETRGSVEIDGH